MEPTFIYCPYDIEAFSGIKSEELRTYASQLGSGTLLAAQVVMKKEASRDCFSI